MADGCYRRQRCAMGCLPAEALGAYQPKEYEKFFGELWSEKQVTSHLFDDGPHDEAVVPLYKKVACCLSIKVKKGDGLPSLLCQTCVQQINTLWCFKKSSEHIDISLRRRLQNKKIDWEVEIKSIAKETETLIVSKHNLLKPSCDSVLKGVDDGTSSPVLVKFESDCHSESEIDWAVSFPSAASSVSDSVSVKSKSDEEDEKQTLQSPHAKRKKKRPDYTCEFCGRKFLRSNHLAQHELTHVAEKPFHCSECDKSFWYKASLIGHIKQTHTGDVNYKCELCGKGFFKKTELTRHKPTHSNETPHKCPQCGMGFKITKTLKRHIRNVHTAQRSYTCHMCGKSFIQSQTLKVHMVLHSGIKPYVCSFCGKGFAQSAPLKTHIRIHTGEKPFSCHACGANFSTRSALNSHAFKHSDTFPYHCKHCSETFRLKKDLVQHEQGHDNQTCPENSIKEELERSFSENQLSSSMVSTDLNNRTSSHNENLQVEINSTR